MIEMINKVEICGIVSAVRYQEIKEGGVFAFTVCTQYTHVSSGGGMIVEQTWHNVKYFPPKAEYDNLVAKLTKGNFAHVWGRLKQTKYIDSEGNERSIQEILANKVEVIEREV